ncbi:MAG: DedA family protein [Croceibacterium sp.]
MHDLIIELISRGGYWGILFLMALENLIPPIPSEVIMGLGGVLVARGQMDFWILLLVGTIGSTAGNYAWFWVGDKWGYDRLGRMVERHGRWLTLDFKHIQQAARFFQKHGQWVVFFLRFSPMLRTMVSLPAGLAHMSVWRFLLFTFVGAGIWNALLIEGGRRLAPYIDKYQQWSSWAIIGLIVLAVLFYIYRVATWKPREGNAD